MGYLSVVLKLFVVGAGGFLGAILRYWLSGWVYRAIPGDFPTGTLMVNLLGSFALGFVLGIVENHIVTPAMQMFLTIGLLGAFTTFSTLSFETYSLIEIGSIGKAALNVGLSLVAGLLAVMAGLVLGRAI